MMKGFGIYLLMQMKRVVKIFPVIFVTTLLLCGSMGALAFLAMERTDSGEGDGRVQVGLVGDIDTYMGVDITAMIRLLSGRFGMSFTKMTEAEAREQLRAGKLSTYVLIPEGLVDALASGANNLTVTYVSAEGHKGIGSMLMDEVASSISGLITTSQSGIYGVQNFLIEQGRGAELHDATDAVNYAYIGALANIYSICDVEIIGSERRVSMAGYYLSSVLIIFMMLGGINSSSLFAGKNTDLPRLLASRGQGAASQVLCEYLAYLALMLLCVIMVLCPLGALARTGYLAIPEWESFELRLLLRFFLHMIPVAAVICAMQFLVYEMVSGMIGSILFQFVGTMALGYLSGCFYPADFFPEGIQRLGSALPVGVALNYLNACLIGREGLLQGLLLTGYLAAFLALAVWMRRRRVGL